MSVKKPKLDLDNARWPEQKATMQACLDAGESPFLLDNLTKYHHQPVIKTGKYWYITPNQWPYDHTHQHYLIIATQYWTRLDQITPEAGAELVTLAAWLRAELDCPGGALCIRFGDTDYSGATIDHLHWQFIVPDVGAPDYDRVHFTVGKKPEKLGTRSSCTPQ